MNFLIPYPDTDYKVGDHRRSWGTLGINVPDLDAFLAAEVSAGRITEGESRFIKGNRAEDVRAAQAWSCVRW